jgi:hypothetical protein
MHSQLTIYLDMALSYCQLLVDTIEAYITAVGGDSFSFSGKKAKWTLLRESRALDGLQKMIDHQTNSLSLLLTACNW